MTTVGKNTFSPDCVMVKLEEMIQFIQDDRILLRHQNLLNPHLDVNRKHADYNGKIYLHTYSDKEKWCII